MHRNHSSPPPPTRSCHLPNNGVWAFRLLSYCVTQHAPSTIHPIIAGMDHLGWFKTSPHKSLSPPALPRPVIFRGPCPLSTEFLFWSLLKDHRLYPPCESLFGWWAGTICSRCYLLSISRTFTKTIKSHRFLFFFFCLIPPQRIVHLRQAWLCVPRTQYHLHITCKRRCILHYKGSGICRRIVQWQICIAWERKFLAYSWYISLQFNAAELPHVRLCASSSRRS